MAYRIDASTANRNKAKYYHKVICHCFGAKNQPQILVMTEAELKEFEANHGARERYASTSPSA